MLRVSQHSPNEDATTMSGAASLFPAILDKVTDALSHGLVMLARSRPIST
jgi:hypothetical protein